MIGLGGTSAAQELHIELRTTQEHLLALQPVVEEATLEISDLERTFAKAGGELKAAEADLEQLRLEYELMAQFQWQVVAGAISMIVLIAALFVVLSKRCATASEKWAFGSVGTILGYWFGQ